MSAPTDLAALSPAQRALLERRLAARVRRPPGDAIPRRPDDGPAPLSFAQRRLWYMQRLAPGSAAYHVAVAHRLRGDLDVAALEAALAEVVRRHRVLRSRLVESAGEPVQEPGPAPAPLLPRIDLGGLPAGRRAGAGRAAAAALAGRVFDLTAAAPLRCGLLRRTATDHTLVVVIHHAAADGWSLGVLYRELGALYAAAADGRPSPLPEPPLQYADYAAWQRRRLHGAALTALIEPWRRRLAGAPADLELPVDRPRAARTRLLGGRWRAALPPAAGARLRALAAARRATPFMVALAALAALLHRYSGQGELTIGTPVANRERASTEGLIGCFVNFLVLRADCRGDPSFATLVERMREVALDAFDRQELPFECLVEALRPERNLDPAPLFRVALALHDAPGGGLRLAGLEVEPLPVEAETVKLDLGVVVAAAGDRLALGLSYNRALFDRTTVQRMGGHLGGLLTAACAHPGRRLSELPLLTAGERHQVAVEWAGAAPPWRRPATLDGLFAAAAAAAPEAVALVSGDLHLSYRELGRRAAALTRRLVRRGAGPGVRVAVALPRSPAQAVALLGVLGAGAVYVPLDPDHPPARLDALLAELRRSAPPGARPPLLLAPPGADLAAAGVEIVVLPGPAAGPVAGEPAGSPPPAPGAGPGDLAYVLFTSGSSGRPKGVEVRHRGAVNVIREAVRVLAAGPRSRVLQLAPLTFDASLLETFLAWGAGGCLVLPPTAAPLVGEALAAALERHAVTTQAIVPSLLGSLPAGAGPAALESLIVGGERCPAEIARRWAGRRLLNAYAPTEASIFATVHRCAAGEGEPALGRPIAGARVRLLDRRLRPVPAGVVGEICLGGAGLARGYLGRPRETAAGFVPDPAGAPGERLYRSGDLGRFRADGELVFRGRIDRQLKLRGVRIEPGEVEAALAAHPAVERALVTAWEPAPGDRRLAAYVALGRGRTVTAAELRAFAVRQLPRALVPAAFTVLERLPLTANGKVDLAALPPPRAASRAAASVPRPPRDGVELRLVELWQRLLGHAPVGVDDDFFALGGHSLLAVEMLAGVSRALGREVPLAAFLARPTVEALAAALDRERPPPRRSPLVAIRPGGAEPPLFCVHSLGGDVVPFWELAGHLPEARPVYGLAAPHLAEVAEPAPSIEELAAGHVAAAAAVWPAGPCLLAGYSFGSTVAFEMAHQLRRAGRRVELLALLDGGAPEVLRRAGDRHATLMLAGVVRDLARAAGVALELPHAEVDRRTPPERVAYLLGRLEAAGLLPPGADRRWVARLLRGVGARGASLLRYRPPPYPGPVLLLRSTEVEEESARAWRAAGVDVDDPARGWDRLVSGPLTIRRVPGYHATMLREPHVVAVAEALTAALTAPAGAAGQRRRK